MKSLKLCFIAASAVLFAVSGLSTAANNAKNQNTRQNAAALAPETASQQAQMPVLRIGGNENPDVYLQSLDIQVEVTGNIASTRYTMIFKNKTERILEGELTFPLADGRSITHYALDINGKMREAVPVEKAKGTQVFEEIEQRRVDPGLLERVEGNNFRTRIYPIPSKGTRTISIGYEEELTLEKELLYYRLPMAYPDPIEKFAVKATVWKSSQKPIVPKNGDEIRFDAAGENYVATLARQNYRPSRALIFALPAPADIPQVMTQPAQGSHYFLASVAPKMETRKKQWDGELAIIWDVSLSGSQRNLKREIEMLDIIFAEKKNANVHLYFLNNKNVKKGEYKVSGGKWDKLKSTLQTAIFDGGTDFSQINVNNPKTSVSPYVEGNEILFFSDGISTLGDADFLKNDKTDRPIHCVVSSAKADYSAMKLIAGKTKGKFVNVNTLSAEKLKSELLNETLQFLGVEHGDDVREVYPSIAAPVHGNFSAAGISESDNAELTLLFGFGNTVEKRIKVKLETKAKNAASQGNIYKIWAQKKIAELDLDYEKNRAELTELGQQFGIVTRNTSLIVLETISDYVLYRIEPPATEPELLAEYQRRVSPSDKSAFTVLRGPSELNELTTEADAAISRVGSLRSADDGRGRKGVAGIGFGGSSDGGSRTGSAASRSDNSNRSRSFVFEQSEVIGYLDQPTPTYIIDMDDPNADPIALDRSFRDALKENVDKDMIVRGSGGGLDLKRPGEPSIASFDFVKDGTLTGARSRASIQRVVMQNSSSLRYAYNRRLREMPDLAGTIKVKFSIDESGIMIAAEVIGSTVNDSTLESTFVDRLMSWEFEKIDMPGDVTVVTYPFTLSDGDVPAQPKKESKRTKAKIARTLTNEQIAQERVNREARAREREEALAREEAAARARREEERVKAEAAERARREEAQLRKDAATLYEAIMAAQNLKKWWNLDFTPKKPKYPMPDAAGGASSAQNKNTVSAKDGSVKPDYLKKLTGKSADDYQMYLKLRNDHASSPVFYFDMSRWFYTLGDMETALRVLTSIADLELENASLYRLLGYRFKEYGEYALEKFVCKKVVQWRPMEPQSYRDYALALADNGETQAALDSLYGLLVKSYSDNIRNRSRGIEEIIVTEINHLIAKNPSLNTSKINERLITDIPVDVRVVINWNMDNTDIDLHVEDPNREECYFRHRETGIGGRISKDITSGYGPEQFLLKNAVKGKYRIYVNYYSDRQFTAAGPSTILAEIYTKYADKSERRKVVSLQMSNAKKKGDGKVEVAEFDF